MEELHSFELVEVHQETADVRSYIFKPQDETFTWVAGQYLDWQLPHDNPDDRGQRRWFSISSAPSEGHVMLSTRFAENGSTLKQRLVTLKPGDIVEAKGPMGSFTAEATDETLVLVAGGIGITPFRSILAERAAKGTLTGIVLIYGNKTEDNVPFKELFDELSAQHNGFSVHYVFGTHINADVIKDLLGSLEDKTYMISGLEKMVAAIDESLQQAGVPKDQIKTDDFGGYDWNIASPVYQ